MPGHFSTENVRKFLNDNLGVVKNPEEIISQAFNLEQMNGGVLHAAEIEHLFPGPLAARFIIEVTESKEHRDIFAKATGRYDTTGNFGVAGAAQAHVEPDSQMHPEPVSQVGPDEDLDQTKTSKGKKLVRRTTRHKPEKPKKPRRAL